MVEWEEVVVEWVMMEEETMEKLAAYSLSTSSPE